MQDRWHADVVGRQGLHGAPPGRRVQGVRLAATVLAALLLAATPVQAKGLGPQGDLGLDYLAARASGAATLAPPVVEAAAANGLDPAQWPTPADPVARHVEVPGEGAANISLLRPLRALALAGDPRAAPEGELTRRVLALVRHDGFGDPRQLNDDAYAILALRAAGLAEADARLQPMRERLTAAQAADGGWGWSATARSGTDMTGMAVEALHASGGIPDSAAVPVRAFLASTQQERGFSELPGGSANCESTAWGLRASGRLGMAVRDRDWWFLLGLQQPDGGFAHLPGGASDLLCTAEAVAVIGEARAGALPGPAQGRGSIAGPALGTTVALLAATTWMAMSTRVRHP